ncbi:SPOR domain-containing protein [Phaeobacter marinintestinus]|uniref:SPOR domain-containing protein n=1 Tax=Falsiphaeobacter marinintestinus TaxID=1492905 RepID=UPI0011B7AC19|nr:SPOR domain-containing protein [Phaeobacter marinintestinus]
MTRAIVRSARSARLIAVLATTGLLAACEEGPKMAFLQPKGQTEASTSSSASTTLVERDVEAPDVFQVTESGLWDGRPSLGGVWVAHPDVTEPERVIIRNPTNGKFVIGALFRRERDIPGPRVQASSDAAVALGMLAGAPVELNVTALRREAVKTTPPEEEKVAMLDDGGDISEAALDPIAGAAAAIDAPEPQATTEAIVAATEAPAPVPAKPISSSLDKPYVQIGIFSVEANANRTADQMRNAGMIPTVFKEDTNGKAYWRVVVGPAKTTSERSALLKEIKTTGFSDAYVVRN